MGKQNIVTNLQKSSISKSSIKNKLNPHYITGFADGESCFLGGFAPIIKDKRNNTGWNIQAFFQIGLHCKDKALLEQIRAYFSGAGGITPNRKDIIQYRVSSISQLTQIIIPHFIKFPLLTQKRADFELFKQILDIINRKEHLTLGGLQQIVNLRASMNFGLSDKLKAAFPNTEPVARSSVDLIEITDPNWLAGFTDADGCFLIHTKKTAASKQGMQVRLIFRITQHTRGLRTLGLLNSFIKYLGCGSYLDSGRGYGDFVVRKLSDMTENIIPFFDAFHLQGVKALDYADFRKVAEIMKAKGHLTPEGLDQIQLIKTGTNRSRLN